MQESDSISSSPGRLHANEGEKRPRISVQLILEVLFRNTTAPPPAVTQSRSLHVCIHTSTRPDFGPSLCGFQDVPRAGSFSQYSIPSQCHVVSVSSRFSKQPPSPKVSAGPNFCSHVQQKYVCPSMVERVQQYLHDCRVYWSDAST